MRSDGRPMSVLKKSSTKQTKSQNPSPSRGSITRIFFAPRSHQRGKRKPHEPLPMRSDGRPMSVLKKSSTKQTKSQNPSPSRGSITRIFFAPRSHQRGKRKPHEPLPMRSDGRPMSVLKKSSTKQTKSQNPSPSRGSITRIFFAPQSHRSGKRKPREPLPMRSGVKLRNCSGDSISAKPRKPQPSVSAIFVRPPQRRVPTTRNVIVLHPGDRTEEGILVVPLARILPTTASDEFSFSRKSAFWFRETIHS
jgi:hypothetical protein